MTNTTLTMPPDTRLSHARMSPLLCISKARILLRAEPAETDALRGAIASRTARSVRTLCGHYDRLVPR
ncbi:hypothetical protein [Streptomyces pseudovenezuelae]|uniref:Transposase n=1 Tax=Streptomyces pseudovenezuelae TaxID=67350 RepID=A0ABT6LYW6_9ACTN|nr:hypothetical protein [Streptomyces pseudovenezuelae]MDH6221487.1 hypothetical protein [Streptomyces pseudovenezuelae]